MTEPINGSDVILYINDPLEGNIPFACGLNASLSVNLSLIPVTNYASNNFEEFRPNVVGWDVTVTGLLLTGNYDFTKSLRDQKARSLVFIQFSIKTASGSYQVYSGYCWPTNNTITGNYNEAGGSSVTFKGTGAYTVSSVNPPVNTTGEMRLEYTVGADTTTLTFAQLIGTTMIEFFRGGSASDTIITAGTPVDDQVKFTSGVGQIDVSSANPLLAGEKGYIIYR